MIASCVFPRMKGLLSDILILQSHRDIVLLGSMACWRGGETITNAMNKTRAAEAVAKALFLPAQLSGEVSLYDEDCLSPFWARGRTIFTKRKLRRFRKKWKGGISDE